MKKKISLLMVMLMVLTMIISTAAIPVYAETTTYTPIGGSASFIKNLVVNADTNIPDLVFSYDIKRGDGVNATTTTVEIIPGIGAIVGDTVFFK